MVLERGMLPSGASTKNAGFACFGSYTEILDDIEKFGEELSLKLVEMRWEGLRLLKQRLGAKEIGFVATGGYELMARQNSFHQDRFAYLNDLLRPIFRKDTFVDKSVDINFLGFNHVSKLLFTPFEGQIHTGSMMRRLIQKAYSHDIMILTGAEVEGYESIDDGLEIFLKNTPAALHSKKLAICTNAFTNHLVSDLDIDPGRGLVLITQPLGHVPFKGNFHMDEGFYYFRDLGNRVLLGGGRNMDFQSENTHEFGINEIILNNLKEKLSTIILPKISWEIDQTWSGVMAFGKTKMPIIKKISPNVILGVRLGGMGVAIGSIVGQKVAGLMTDH